MTSLARFAIAVCQDSKVFLTRKFPLSITRALLKSMEGSFTQACEAMLEPFLKVFVFPICSFFLVCLTYIPPRTVGAWDPTETTFVVGPRVVLISEKQTLVRRFVERLREVQLGL